MTQVYIKLQTPTIELPVTAVDGSGTKDKLIAGFIRHNNAEAADILDQYKSAYDEGDSEGSGTMQSALDADAKAVDIMRSNISYLKKAVLYTEENGKLKPFKTVEDTRTAKDEESLWGDADNCLAFLLDMYLASTPWRLSFTQEFMTSLGNTATLSDEARTKN